MSYLAKTIAYYDPLLLRYARRLVHNEEIADAIVLDVLERQYELNVLVPGKHLRLFLKTDVLNSCLYYLQMKKSRRKPGSFPGWMPNMLAKPTH